MKALTFVSLSNPVLQYVHKFINVSSSGTVFNQSANSEIDGFDAQVKFRMFMVSRYSKSTNKS